MPFEMCHILSEFVRELSIIASSQLLPQKIPKLGSKQGSATSQWGLGLEGQLYIESLILT